MKRLLFVISVCFLALTVLNCGDDGASIDDTGECAPGGERCSGDIVQHCEDGSWVDVTNCSMMFAVCVEEGGEAQCTGSDTDIDTDADTDGEWDRFEDFESYQAGDLIVETSGYPWVTWSDPSLPVEDALVSDAVSLSGENSLHIVEDNDVIWMTELTDGHWQIEFDIFIEEGNLAYYSVVQITTPSIQRAFAVYFYSSETGFLVLDGEEIPFRFKQGKWFTVSHLVDINEENIILIVDGFVIHDWAWTDGVHLDGLEFLGLTEAPGSDFYIDDLRYREL